jgi:hypothetical protein
VAKTRIQVGEDVTDCYGIHHLSIEKATRLSTLQKSFLFNCQCKVRGWVWMLSFLWEDQEALHPAEELPLQLPVQGKGGGGGCYLSIEKTKRFSTLQKSFLFNSQCKVREWGWMLSFLWED